MDLLPLAIVPVLFIIIVLLYIFFSAVKVLREYERAVVFRLGRLSKALINPGGTGNGPGLILLIPVVDKMVTVSLRTVAMNVPSQDVITRDNVSLKVDAVIYFRVMDPERAVVAVEDYLFATSQMARPPCAACWVSPSWTSYSRSATGSTRCSSASLTSTPSRGGSRSAPSR